MFTKALEAVKSKVPISEPCKDSTPAKGCPSCNAVNLATVSEVLIPDGSGFATISKGGLVSFSNTVHVQSAPYPSVSKSIGAF